MPSPLRMAVTAAVVTGLVVALGIVASPGSDRESIEARGLSRAAKMAPAPDPEGAVPPAEPPPWWETPEVTFKPKPKPKPKPVPPPATDFVISSFNVLGSSHTAPGGKLARMSSGPTRIRQVVTLLSHHAVDVVGFQELQADQYREFVRVAGGSFAAYPGTAAGVRGIENSVAWRRSTWTLEQSATIQIPYFRGRERPMPYVLLRHNVTGRRAWFANFHNPATTRQWGNNARWRAVAMAREAALAVRLRAETGYPVFITGDLNEREAAFCTLAGNAAMVASNGGSYVDGSCQPPPSPLNVDWIFGSDMVAFSDHYRDDSGLVNRTSDHPMIVARAVLDEWDGAPQDDVPEADD